MQGTVVTIECHVLRSLDQITHTSISVIYFTRTLTIVLLRVISAFLWSVLFLYISLFCCYDCYGNSPSIVVCIVLFLQQSSSERTNCLHSRTLHFTARVRIPVVKVVLARKKATRFWYKVVMRKLDRQGKQGEKTRHRTNRVFRFPQPYFFGKSIRGKTLNYAFDRGESETLWGTVISGDVRKQMYKSNVHKRCREET